MKPAILLVDFEPRSLADTRQLLEDAGYPVRVATTREQVDEAVAGGGFRVAVIEPVIPPLDGFELARRLKRGNASPPIVIIASRVFRGPRFKNMARATGCDAFLERPQQEHLLVPALERLVPPAAGPAGQQRVQAPPPEPVPSPPAGPRATQPAPKSPPSPEPTPAAAAFSAPPAETPADLPLGQALDLGELTGIADDEIDDAFEKMIGVFDEPEPGSSSERAAAPPASPAMPPARKPPAPDGGEFLAELQALPLDFGQTPEDGSDAPLAGTLFPDDHAAALEEDEESAARARVLDSPNQFGAEELSASGPAPEPAEDAGALEFDSSVAKLADSGPQAASGPGGLELPLDLEAAESSLDGALADLSAELPPIQADPPAPAAAQVPPPAPPAATTEEGPAGLEERLDAIFRGEVRLDDEDDSGSSSGPVTGEPLASVPDNLRGMDASTADLLSSLAELEDSIPGNLADDPGAVVVDSGPYGAGESIPIAPPPPLEDELTLEEIFSRVSEPASLGMTPEATGLEEPEPAGPSPAAPSPAPVPEPVDALPVSDRLERISEPPDEDAAPEAAAAPVAAEERGWRRWFSFSLVAVALIGLGGASAVLWWRSAEAGAATARLEGAAAPEIAGPAAGDTGPLEVSEERATADPAGGPPQQAPIEDLAQTRRPLADLPAEPAGEPTLEEQSRTAGTEERVPEPTPPEKVAVSEPRRPQPVEAAERSGTAPAPAQAPAATPGPSDRRQIAQPAGPAPIVPLGALDEPVEVLESPLPFLTEEAARLGIRERAFVNVLIGTDGRVEDVELLRDPGHGLGERAVEAARGWRYTVPKRGGAPVRVWKTEGLSFLKNPS